MTRDGWSFSEGGTHLSTPTGRTVSLPFPIAEILPVAGIVVVRLIDEGMPNEEASRNVVAVSQDGVVIWQIAAHPWTWGRDPYTRIVVEGEDVRLFNFNGFVLTVDPKSGHILHQEETR